MSERPSAPQLESSAQTRLGPHTLPCTTFLVRLARKPATLASVSCAEARCTSAGRHAPPQSLTVPDKGRAGILLWLFCAMPQVYVTAQHMPGRWLAHHRRGELARPARPPSTTPASLRPPSFSPPLHALRCSLPAALSHSARFRHLRSHTPPPLHDDPSRSHPRHVSSFCARSSQDKLQA